MALSDAENCQSAAVTEPATVVCQPTVSVKSNRVHIPYPNLIKFNHLFYINLLLRSAVG